MTNKQKPVSIKQRLRIEIHGAVQGVGFRPFVYRLATEYALTGWVINDTRGVFIEVEGAQAELARFLERLPAETPPRAIVHSLESTWLEPAGYERFEIGTDASREPFLNVEIFETLYVSSLVITDLTGLRQNCLLELGYALGLGKRAILTAREGTKLPFDSAAIPCHFWSEKQSDEKRRMEFEDFMKKNINRRTLVS